MLRDTSSPVMLHACTHRYRSLLLLGVLPFAMPIAASLVVAALAVVVYVVVAEPVARRAAPPNRRSDDAIDGLSSPDVDEVLATIDTITARGISVPSLVLYHPNPTVVRRALSAMDQDRDLGRVLPHLLAHSDPTVRAAALAHAH
jgi:hypothetical protein